MSEAPLEKLIATLRDLQQRVCILESSSLEALAQRDAELVRQRDALAALVREAAQNVWSYDGGCPFCWVTDEEKGVHRDDCRGMAALQQLEGDQEMREYVPPPEMHNACYDTSAEAEPWNDVDQKEADDD